MAPTPQPDITQLYRVVILYITKTKELLDEETKLEAAGLYADAQERRNRIELIRDPTDRAVGQLQERLAAGDRVPGLTGPAEADFREMMWSLAGTTGAWVKKFGWEGGPVGRPNGGSEVQVASSEGSEEQISVEVLEQRKPKGKRKQKKKGKQRASAEGSTEISEGPAPTTSGARIDSLVQETTHTEDSQAGVKPQGVCKPDALAQEIATETPTSKPPCVEKGAMKRRLSAEERVAHSHAAAAAVLDTLSGPGTAAEVIASDRPPVRPAVDMPRIETENLVGLVASAMNNAAGGPDDHPGCLCSENALPAERSRLEDAELAKDQAEPSFTAAVAPCRGRSGSGVAAEDLVADLLAMGIPPVQTEDVAVRTASAASGTAGIDRHSCPRSEDAASTMSPVPEATQLAKGEDAVSPTTASAPSSTAGTVNPLDTHAVDALPTESPRPPTPLAEHNDVPSTTTSTPSSPAEPQLTPQPSPALTAPAAPPSPEHRVDGEQEAAAKAERKAAKKEKRARKKARDIGTPAKTRRSNKGGPGKQAKVTPILELPSPPSEVDSGVIKLWDRPALRDRITGGKDGRAATTRCEEVANSAARSDSRTAAAAPVSSPGPSTILEPDAAGDNQAAEQAKSDGQVSEQSAHETAEGSSGLGVPGLAPLTASAPPPASRLGLPPPAPMEERDAGRKHEDTVLAQSEDLWDTHESTPRLGEKAQGAASVVLGHEAPVLNRARISPHLHQEAAPPAPAEERRERKADVAVLVRKAESRRFRGPLQTSLQPGRQRIETIHEKPSPLPFNRRQITAMLRSGEGWEWVWDEVYKPDGWYQCEEEDVVVGREAAPDEMAIGSGEFFVELERQIAALERRGVRRVEKKEKRLREKEKRRRPREKSREKQRRSQERRVAESDEEYERMSQESQRQSREMRVAESDGEYERISRWEWEYSISFRRAESM